jgi:hypothetical protein
VSAHVFSDGAVCTVALDPDEIDQLLKMVTQCRDLVRDGVTIDHFAPKS